VIAIPRPRSVLLCALLLVAAACGGSDDGGGGGATAGAGGPPSTGGQAAPTPGDTIVIANFDFAPEVLQVRVGDTITVDNKDDAEHTVTATDKSFDTGAVPTGKTTFTVTRAGRFEYVCEIHPFMPHRFIQVVG
jgi:plastocyanin